MTTPQNPLRALSRVKTQVYPEVRSNLHTPPKASTSMEQRPWTSWAVLVACDGQELTGSTNT